MTQTPEMFAGEVAAERQRAVSTFVTRTFGWMALGLALTGAVAWYTASSGLIETIMERQLMLPLIIAELVLVLVLSFAINKLPPVVAALMFFGYAGLTGLTLSVIFLVYTEASLTSTFLVTAGTFGAMCAYGYFTKRDLSGMGSILFMALIGLVIASVVNMFMASSGLYWLITYAGILIFVGLTAWDMQKIRLMAESVDPHSARAYRASIMGALRLYLDFINLFLLLLRLLGRRR